jgi:NTP pyrophosphatase (non-canonical NTP hydrolase)
VSLNELRDLAHANASAKGFHGDLKLIDDLRSDDRYPQEVVEAVATMLLAGRLALVTSECSEALEVYRKGTANAADPKVPELSQEEGELADILIRVFDLAGARGIDLDRAVTVKMAHNATRPFKHGKRI